MDGGDYPAVGEEEVVGRQGSHGRKPGTEEGEDGLVRHMDAPYPHALLSPHHMHHRVEVHHSWRGRGCGGGGDGGGC